MKGTFVRKTYEQKHLEDLERLRNFRLLDDDFMTKVFEDTGCTELLLRIVLQRSDLTVQRVQTQYEIKNLQGRSVRLDIFAVDNAGKCYNIEVQRSDKGAGYKRARYNSSMMDANVTEPGEDYQNLAETYVIFITEHDVPGAGLPLYHISRVIEETGEKIQDGTHILYVNAQVKDETELGKLMQDFACMDADEMHYPELADRVRYFKKSAEGVTGMCRALEAMRKEEREEGREEGRQEGREEGRQEGRKEGMLKGIEAGRQEGKITLVQRMLLAKKYTFEEIAELSGLSIEEIEGLADKSNLVIE